jgi:hypothetical protein
LNRIRRGCQFRRYDIESERRETVVKDGSPSP